MQPSDEMTERHHSPKPWVLPPDNRWPKEKIERLEKALAKMPRSPFHKEPQGTDFYGAF